MVKITEELIRKRAEHNEGEIFSLQELSLHQQNIEKIEYLDKWCKELKILYLQSNLISKIENVGRLKNLEYLNLALNNIERIENLEGCEFLKKLDLTVNFIGELTSIESLTENYHLEEMYLTGNPCTEFEGYRDYVISILPRLKSLDGVEIKRSDQIKALQNCKKLRDKICKQQDEYFKKREKQKESYKQMKETNSSEYNDENFWNEKSEYTPESRLETARIQEEQKRKQDEERTKKQLHDDYASNKKERKFFDSEGKPYSFNDPKVDYEYNGDDDANIILTVHVFKYMDNSLVNVDVQPNYVRVTLKGKSLQIALGEEVNPDSSTAKRSQTTGHLVITMPKANPVIRQKNNDENKTVNSKLDKKDAKKVEPTNANYLEVDESKKASRIDLANIVNNNTIRNTSNLMGKKSKQIRERDNSPDFQDNSEVPPLE